MTDDIFWLEFFKIAIPAVSTIFMAMITLLMQRLNKHTAKVEMRAEETKEILVSNRKGRDEQFQEIKKIGEATHSLVNGSFAVQLKINLLTLRRLAKLANDPDVDKELAEAEKVYRDHESKLQQAEAGLTTPIDPKRDAAFSISEHEKAKTMTVAPKGA